MSELGVVKFHCEHVVADLPRFAGFDELNACRRKLLQICMIGVDSNGIGFGNLSVRSGDTNQFFITGSATGGIAQLSLNDYAQVTGFDLAKNQVRCVGRVIASSESLTHAAVYESVPEARAVIHCHSRRVWSHQLARGRATSSQVEYGTPEMAFDVQRLFRTSELREEKIFAMGGHEDGVIAFGANIADAFAVLLRSVQAPRS